MQIISDKNSVPNNIDLHKIVTEHLVLGPAFCSRLQIEKEDGLPMDLVARSLGWPPHVICGAPEGAHVQ